MQRIIFGKTWVAWACIAAYGKRALIRICDQPPLVLVHDQAYMYMRETCQREIKFLLLTYIM